MGFFSKTGQAVKKGLGKTGQAVKQGLKDEMNFRKELRLVSKKAKQKELLKMAAEGGKEKARAKAKKKNDMFDFG